MTMSMMSDRQIGGGAASCGGGLAAQPMIDIRYQHMGPGAALTSKHLHCIVSDSLCSLPFDFDFDEFLRNAE